MLKVLVVPMVSPRSYTREGVVELQCHGNDLCLRRVLRACLEAGARLTDPEVGDGSDRWSPTDREIEREETGAR